MVKWAPNRPEVEDTFHIQGDPKSNKVPHPYIIYLDAMRIQYYTVPYICTTAYFRLQVDVEGERRCRTNPIVTLFRHPGGEGLIELNQPRLPSWLVLNVHILSEDDCYIHSWKIMEQ